MKFVFVLMTIAAVITYSQPPSNIQNQNSTESYFTSVASEPEPIINWALDAINSSGEDSLTDNRFETKSTGKGVTVYVVDTGFAYIDEVNFLEAWNFTGEEDTDELSCYNHGTMMSSAIAGDGVGVAPDAGIISLKVITCDKTQSKGSYVYDALQWIIDNHVSTPAVVNMSLSIDTDAYPELEELVNTIISLNIPVVVAAGNDSRDACLNTPANFVNAITVGGYKIEGSPVLSDVSNFGSCVDILAPAQNAEVIGSSGSHVTANGTSIATAYVSGVIATFLERNPNSTVADVEAYLYSNALNINVEPSTVSRILSIR